MKAERINQDQVRFILSAGDLQQRNLKISELVYGSEKTKALFADMMKTALDQFGMDFSQKPLMIEAIPMSGSGLAITVTRVSGMAEVGALFGSNMTDDPMSRTESMEPAEGRGESQGEAEESFGGFENLTAAKSATYVFKNFEQLCLAAQRIPKRIVLQNMLYRAAENGSYYLIVHYKKMDRPNRFVAAVLSQYAESWFMGEHMEKIIAEHGKAVLRARAIQKLAAVEQTGYMFYEENEEVKA